jgi:hypothetical protein
MRIIKLFIFSAVILYSCVDIKAQEDILERVKTIKVMSSTKQEVERNFGKPSNSLPLREDDKEIISWYINDNEALEITYSDGKCTLGWNVPKDIVIGIYLNFKEERKFSELESKLKREKINLNKLRMETALDVEGERAYYDDTRGIKYVVNVSEKIWSSITFYPSSKDAQFGCKN